MGTGRGASAGALQAPTSASAAIQPRGAIRDSVYERVALGSNEASRPAIIVRNGSTSADTSVGRWLVSANPNRSERWAPASRRALQQAGMQVGDIDLWEINEAFAVVPIETMRALEVDPARVNVNGGAIALGHPLGATGAMLLGTVVDELERRGLATGLVTMCIGGGQGIAVIVERV
mgnify:CR=1 FL=1